MSDLCTASFTDVYQYTEPDKALAAWYYIFSSIFDKHAPAKIKRVKSRDKPPWLTDEIKEAIHVRDNLLKSSGKGEE